MKQRSSELFDGGTPEMQKKKRITFYTICITVLLIGALLLFLSIFGIASLLSQDKDSSSPSTSIGKTKTTEISESIHSGSLLILNSENKYQGEKLSLSNLEERTDRPKKSDGKTNAYTVYKPKQSDFEATETAAAAINKMLGAFFKSEDDDNVIIYNAYDSSNAEDQDAIYSSGEAFELKCFFEGNTSDVRSIYDIELYEWIYSNAYKYGFINVGEKTSIFKYIGVEHATAMIKENLAFEAYLEFLKKETSAKEPFAVTASGVKYAIYYLAEDAKHTVPTQFPYEISGNNVDGYIITVNLSKTNTKD